MSGISRVDHVDDPVHDTYLATREQTAATSSAMAIGMAVVVAALIVVALYAELTSQPTTSDVVLSEMPGRVAGTASDRPNAVESVTGRSHLQPMTNATGGN